MVDVITSDADQTLASRPLVPSEREVDTGLIDHAFVPEPPQPLPPPLRTRIVAGVRSGASDLTPRSIAAGGSAFPLLLVSALTLVTELDNNAFGILLPDLRNVYNVNLSFLLGTAIATLVVSYAFAPLIGHLADRVNRVWAMRAGWVIRFGVGNVLTALSPSAIGFGASRALGSGVGAALFTPMRGPFLVDSFRPSRFARVLGLLGIGTFIGTNAGPVLAGVLDVAIGPAPTLLLFGAIGLALSLALFLVREPERGGMARAELAEQGIELPPSPPPVRFGEALRALKGIQTVKSIWFALPFVSAAALGVNLFLGLYYLFVFNAGPIERGFLIAFSGLGGIAALLVWGPLADRLFRERPARVITVVAALLVAEGLAAPVIAVMPNEWMAAVVGFVPSFSAALMLTATLTIASRVVPARIIGAGQGTFLFFFAVGIAVVLPVIFYLSARFGYRVAIVYLLPISLLAALIVSRAGPHVEKDMAAASLNQLASEEARRSRESGRNKMLICRGVEVFFESAQVLFGVNLDVEEGELVALLGTNGAGKSTLLRAIAGVQSATYGAIFIDGIDVTHSTAHLNAEMGVVFVPGGHAVFPSLTTAENLHAAAWLSRRDDADVKARTAEALELFPVLRERMHAQAGNMSGGEQQMLALAQALIMKPRLLMIDELSLGLAPQVVEQLLEVVRRIHAQGTTIIVVEQSVNVALVVAERAIYMERGQIRYDGPAAELVGRNDVVHSIFLAGTASASLGAGDHTEGRRRDGDEHQEVLVVDDVALSYGGVQVLDGVSLRVVDREVVGIVGPNGAGKTSLFDVIAGFGKPSRGLVTLAGTDVTRMSPDARARLGLARSYQNVRLFPALTVRENIAVALERHLRSRSALLAAVWSPSTRRSERRVNRRVDNLIGSLGLGPFAGKFMSELSTGTRRIVDIACVLAAGPRVLLLDEPSSGLAQAETEQLAPVIGRIVKEAACAIVVIEHDLGLVAAVSDRLVAMRLGSVMAEGPPRKVLDDDQVVDTLLGGVSAAVVQRSVELTPATAGERR